MQVRKYWRAPRSNAPFYSKGGLPRDIQHLEPLWDRIITYSPNLIFKMYGNKHEFVESTVILPSIAAYPHLLTTFYQIFAI